MPDFLRRLVVKPVALVVRHVLRKPRLARLVAKLPARMHPGGRWITGHEDVVDVLRRDREFGMPYLSRMDELGAPFILGLNPSESYQRQVDALRAALGAIDLESLGVTSREQAERYLRQCNGSVDVLALTHQVLAATVGRELWSGGPLSNEQLAQTRAISRDIFINPWRDPGVQRRGERALRAVRRDVDGIVAARKRERAGAHDDVLDRLLAADGVAFKGDELIDDLLGILVAWVTSVSRTIGWGMDELLRRERSDELARAQEAALDDDVFTVGTILLEALRFRPSMPALERVCTRRARVNGETVARDDKLMLVLTTAMVDEHASRAELPGAREFRIGRPREAYLHFGRGTHRCLGANISSVQMQEIAGTILRRRNVRRKSRLHLAGPFPDRLAVVFEA